MFKVRFMRHNLVSLELIVAVYLFKRLLMTYHNVEDNTDCPDIDFFAVSSPAYDFRSDVG